MSTVTINEINTQIQNAMKSGDRDQIKELMKKRKDLMAKSTANIKSTSKRKLEREEELCGICQFSLSEPVGGIIKAGKWTANEQEKAECFSCATMTDAQYMNSTNLDYSCLNSDGNIYSGSRRPGRTRDSFSHHHKFHKACIKKHLLTNDMVDFGFGPQDDLGSYLEKSCPICRDKCITRNLHRGWGYEAYQYRCSHHNCEMVEYFVSPEEARNHPHQDDHRKGNWHQHANGNWLCKYHGNTPRINFSCDAKDVYGTRFVPTTFMTSCDYTPQADTEWNFTQIAGNDDEETTKYITTCPHHNLLFCGENDDRIFRCTDTYKHFSNDVYQAYREVRHIGGMLNFKCLNCNSWYTDKQAIPHNTHWEILCNDCHNRLSLENLTLEQYGLDNVKFYCGTHIYRIRCAQGLHINNQCSNERYLCGDEQWNRFIGETESTEDNDTYWMVDRDSRYFCPEHRRRIGQRDARWRRIHNVNQFGGKRKKKSKKNIRMHKKTRRKRGANKEEDDLYAKRQKDGAKQRKLQSEYIEKPDRNKPYVSTPKSKKKPLTFGQTSCKSDRDCKSNEICSGGNEKNEGVCVKPVIKYTGELHYDNPRQKLLASLEPLDGYKGWFYDNKTDTYLQYDLKRKKFLYQSNKHPSDLKRQRAMASVKRKLTRKFGKNAGKRKKKTRRRKGGNIIQTFSSINQLKGYLNQPDVILNGDEPREFKLFENGVEIKPLAGFNSLYLTWVYHLQSGDNDIKFYQTFDDGIWDDSSIQETKTFGIEQLKKMTIVVHDELKYKYASVGGKRKKKTRKKRGGCKWPWDCFRPTVEETPDEEQTLLGSDSDSDSDSDRAVSLSSSSDSSTGTIDLDGSALETRRALNENRRRGGGKRKKKTRKKRKKKTRKRRRRRKNTSN